jgi:hypothetical protein
MSEQEKLTACLDISRRLSPANVEETLGLFVLLLFLIIDSDLIFIAEDVRDSLLSNIDVPLKTVLDTSVGRPFITSDYNRDGDSYRYGLKYIKFKFLIDLLIQINIFHLCLMLYIPLHHFENWKLK